LGYTASAWLKWPFFTADDLERPSLKQVPYVVARRLCRRGDSWVGSYSCQWVASLRSQRRRIGSGEKRASQSYLPSHALAYIAA